MSRVHDALRRAEQGGLTSPPATRAGGEARATAVIDAGPNLTGLLEQVQEIPFHAAPDSLLIDVSPSVAEVLDMKRAGIVTVAVEPVAPAPSPSP
jgi:hypothetical protein